MTPGRYNAIRIFGLGLVTLGFILTISSVALAATMFSP